MSHRNQVLVSRTKPLETGSMAAADCNHESVERSVPLSSVFAAYVNVFLLFFLGRLRDQCRSLVDKVLGSRIAKGSEYAPLCSDYFDFFVRRVYRRLEDCFNRPVASAPTVWMKVEEREYDSQQVLSRTGRSSLCLNMSSYGYLGFGNRHPYCQERALATLHSLGTSTCASRMDGGSIPLHDELEQSLADFFGKPAAFVTAMGFAGNSLTLPALLDENTLVLSDELNHASIVTGLKASKAKIKIFKHNDPADLEKVLRKSMAEGQQSKKKGAKGDKKERKEWRKIVIAVEGVFSTEGTVCKLREMVAIKKKYKAYLYLDEAHSCGGVGPTGRGVCELTGVDPADVDIIMGTFSKAFSACGSFIAATEECIAYLKAVCPSHLYGTAMSPPVAQQVLSILRVLTGQDGTTEGFHRLSRLHTNARWFRRQLLSLGLTVRGSDFTPVMPIMIKNIASIGAFSRGCLKRNVAVVVVGYPATPLLECRARICLSSAHTRADMEYALQVIADVAHHMGMIPHWRVKALRATLALAGSDKPAM